MAIGPRKKRAITNLCTLFDTEPCSIEETNQLITVTHDKLVEAFTYWIDQSKTFFGEPAIVRSFHSFKEEGIDITIDLLMQPQVRFGIQIKSYKDIQKKSFAGQVHEQISRSHKHNLSKLMLAFAGDMNDMSKNPKVSGIVSEIHQNKGDNDYVIVIPPQQVLTIYRAYKEQQHPLKFIKLDLQRASELSAALGESLSNDLREAKISMHIEYKKMDSSKYPIRIKLRHILGKGELDLLDQLEHMSAAGEGIKIPGEKVIEFQVYENDKPILANGVKPDLVITRDNLVVPLVLQTVSENGHTIKSLDHLNFIVKEKHGQFVYEFFDKDHPLSIKIPVNPIASSASFSINLCY